MSAPSKISVKIARWQAPGAAGFFAFLGDVRPMIPSEKGPLQPYDLPNERVKAEITAALDGDYSTVVWCWPRRHGKTVVSALVIIWRFLTRQNQAIAIIANSATQTTDTAFRLVKTILEGTPYTRALIDNVPSSWARTPSPMARWAAASRASPAIRLPCSVRS